MEHPQQLEAMLSVLHNSPHLPAALDTDCFMDRVDPSANCINFCNNANCINLVTMQ